MSLAHHPPARHAYEAYARHVNPAMGQFLKFSGRDIHLVQGSGCVLRDSNGKSYDDWIAGFGTFNLGHNPEALKQQLTEHLAQDVPNLYVENLNPYSGLLAERLTQLAGSDFTTCFFSNSGTEAVEAAIKTALAATDRKKILRLEGAYHGATLGSLACTGKGIFRDRFESVLPDFTEIAWGDLNALETHLRTEKFAALIFEPIQVEAGIRVASSEFVASARQLCHKFGTLLILDEVQTGMGRTGTLFTYQSMGFTPDIFVIAKAFGGGMVPIGATVMAKGIWDRAFGTYLSCESHNSTFGGNAISCTIAHKTLDLISAPEFLATVRLRSLELFSSLESSLKKIPLLIRITWKGLLGGIQLKDPEHPWFSWENFGLSELSAYPVAGPLMVERLQRKGILAQVCAYDWSTLRIQPPLIVDKATCERFVAAVHDSLEWLTSTDSPATRSSLHDD